MLKPIGLLLTILFVWSPANCFAQFSTNEFSISFLTTRDGLSQASNRYMLQDKKGYMWISSQDGINRYNGLSFFHFDDLRYFEGCEPFKEVFGLAEDSGGNIWTGSAQGLYCFSQKAEKFTKVNLPNEHKKRSFVKPFAKVNGEIWVSDEDSFIYAVTPDTKKVRLLFQPPDSLRLHQANYINPQVDKSDKIWTFSENEIIAINVHTATVQRFRLLTGNKSGDGAEVRSIALEFRSGILALSTIKGLKLFDIVTKKFISINDPENWITNNEIHCVKAEEGNFLLSAKGHPLLQIDVKTKSMVSLLDTQTTGHHLPQSYEPVCLYKDKWNRIWYNMDGEFIAIIDFAKPFFKKLTRDMIGGLPQGTVASICAIGDSVLISDGKLTLLNKKTGLTTRTVFPSHFRDLASDYNAVWHDSTENRVWLASRENVYYYDIGANKVFKTKFSFPDKVAYFNPIRGFSKIKNGPLIVATTLGVYLWDERTNTNLLVQLHGKSGAVHIDQLSDNRIAVTTFDKYLHLFKIYRKGLQPIASIRFDYIVSGIAEDDRKAFLWAATEQGIYKIADASYKILRHYTKADGMAKDLVYSIRCDSSGWVWCSTNRGIVAIDPADDHIINFNGNDNLQDLEFNRGAVASDKEGYIYFGGVKGINYFKPPFHANDTVTPRLVIEEVSINKQPLSNDAPDEVTEIKYAYGAALLSLKAVAVHLKSAASYKLIYRVNKDPNGWIEIDNGTAIQFFDLSPGRYLLEIGYKNVFNRLSKASRTLAIIVLPPWYQTWWFYVAMALVLSACVYTFFQLRLRQKLQIFRLRNQLHRDLHDDVGATLSSIKAYSEILGRNGSDQVIKKLIQENASEMIDRLEVISWATNPQHDNAKSLTDAMLRFAYPLAHSNGLVLHFKKDIDDNLMMPGNIRQHLLLIFKEAINNMVKYAGATECLASLRTKSQTIELEIADNGKGYNGEVKGSGAGMKNMQKRAKEMGGDIQINSTFGKGTSILLSVPYPFKTTTTSKKEAH